METRKRAASERAPTSSEVSEAEPSSGTQKRAKLVLKPPKFITEAKKAAKPQLQSFSSLLEGVLELETPDEALEQLLKINEQSEPVLGRVEELDMISSLKMIGKLWTKLESNVQVCSVLVRTLVLVARRAREYTRETSVHEKVQMLSLSMMEHGEFFKILCGTNQIHSLSSQSFQFCTWAGGSLETRPSFRKHWV